MNKRKEQKENTIADILRVSQELFHKQGYEKTSIHNIAEQCGLSKGALYHHFKSKEEVLKTICYRHYVKLKETFLPIAKDKQATLLEKMNRIMTIARNSQMNNAAATFSKKESSESSGIENAALSKLFDSYNERIYIEIFAPIFAEGKRKRECNFPCSAEAMAVFIHSLDTGTSEQLNRILHEEDLDSAEERIKDIANGFIFALSQLLDIDEKTLSEATLMDKMVKQYIEILNNKK
ncbi:MAG: TetR/AcrR family transcriptional regulator [Candidatus Cloacimonetes bacterium]|nr:TetR/AcrR family transcriptional regulator [Candidatus Cloacimonadota bacterium]